MKRFWFMYCANYRFAIIIFMRDINDSACDVLDCIIIMKRNIHSLYCIQLMSNTDYSISILIVIHSMDKLFCFLKWRVGLIIK